MEAKKTSCFSVWEVDSCRVLVLFPCLRRDYQKPSWAGKSSLESLSLDLIVSGEVGVQHAQWCPQTVRPSNETGNRKPFSNQNILNDIPWKKRQEKHTFVQICVFVAESLFFTTIFSVIFTCPPTIAQTHLPRPTNSSGASACGLGPQSTRCVSRRPREELRRRFGRTRDARQIETAFFCQNFGVSNFASSHFAS